MPTLSAIAKTTQRFALFSILCLVLTPIVVRISVVPVRIGLLLFALSALSAIVVVILAAVFTRKQKTDDGKKAMSRASVLALPALIFFGISIAGGGGKPVIHEVSTDVQNPPEFVAAIERRGADANPLNFSADVAAQQLKAYPELQTLHSELAPGAAFARALQVAEELGWEVYHEDGIRGTIEAVDTTFFMGFKDDIVIRITATDNGSAIDARSSSRIGGSDLGANAARITKFFNRFQQL